MKKTKKLLILAIVCVLLLSFTGCGYLDNLRSTQAHYQADGTLVWNGEVYKALPDNPYLWPQIDYYTNVYATAEDVPVLLSRTFFLCPSNVSVDRNFLIADVTYCRESLYEELSARLNAPFLPDTVCYTYSDIDFETGAVYDRYHILTQDQWDTLEHILETATPVENNEYWWTKNYWAVTLNLSSSDMLLQKNYLDVCIAEDGYYLHVYGVDALIYQVPDEHASTMDAIVAAYKNSIDYYGID